MNPYYTHSSALPANQTRGTSSSMRTEFDTVAAGFDGVSTDITSLNTEIVAARQGQASLLLNLSRYVSTISGMPGNIAANGFRITGLPTPTAFDEPATKGYADSLVISATAPSWTPSVTAVSKTLAAYEFCRVTASGQTIKFPLTPTAGVTRVGIEFGPGVTGILDPNGKTIKGSAGTMTVNQAGLTLTFLYLDATIGWVLGA